MTSNVDPQLPATTTAVVADDDPEIRETLMWQLETIGCRAYGAADGLSAVDLIEQCDPDVVIIELVLPGLRGLEVLRSTRSRSADSVVIVVSGRADETECIVALEMGADDFVVKPFSPRELLARIGACQRRSSRSVQNESRAGLVFDGISIDVDRREVKVAGHTVQLTRREYDLLVFLASEPGRVYSKSELIAEVWGADPGWIGVATVTEHVRRLRQKIEEDHSSPKWIRTVRGHGYLFEE